MTDALITIAAIATLAVIYILLPVAGDAYRRFVRQRVVTCPQNERLTEIHLDAGYAARSALVGAPKARVNGCTRWPELTRLPGRLRRSGIDSEVTHEVF